MWLHKQGIGNNNNSNNINNSNWVACVIICGLPYHLNTYDNWATCKGH
jgi:hypothetical protein